MRISPDKTSEPDRQLLAMLAALGVPDRARAPTDIAARLARFARRALDGCT